MTAASMSVPAARANREFSKLLRAAKEGVRITITSHGEPVAEMGPVGGRSAEGAEKRRVAKAQKALMKHLRTTTPIVVGPWTREELYDRDR
jgi:antitoxin (DNA-binding transcriptional repressor) of toxin-antitoxin stability system